MARSTRCRASPSHRWRCSPAAPARSSTRRPRSCAVPAWWWRRWPMWDNFTPAMLELFASSLWETLVMVGISGLAGSLIGIPLGVLLRLTDRGGVLQNTGVNRVVGGIVNAVRSTPFIILLVAIIPFTRLITGSSIGTAAAVVPLTLAAAPFIARLVEASLREVDHGLVEAAQAMGASTSQIVFKVPLPEALPGSVP